MNRPPPPHPDAVWVGRHCPIPGFDVALLDEVVWQGKPWFVNNMVHTDHFGQRLVDLVGTRDNTGVEAMAPIHEVRVFAEVSGWSIPASATFEAGAI